MQVAMEVTGVDKISQECSKHEGRGTEERMLWTSLGIPSLSRKLLEFELFFPISKIFTENLYPKTEAT